jgi:hypothetical protein
MDADETDPGDAEGRELFMKHVRAPRMLPDHDKMEENRLRAVARRQGLTLVKSRARDERSALYNTFAVLRDGELVAGDPESGFGLTLDQVTQVLGEVPPEQLRTFRVVDVSDQVVGETTAIDGWAAMAWAERQIRRNGRPRFTSLRIDELHGEEWKPFFESEVGQGRRRL